MPTKRLPIKLTSLLRKFCLLILIIAYTLTIFISIDRIINLLPNIENEIFLFLVKIAVIIIVLIVGISLFFGLILMYAFIEPFIVEKILPQKLKIFFNIDRIEETYTPKENNEIKR